jgi:hypothetical protein
MPGSRVRVPPLLSRKSLPSLMSATSSFAGLTERTSGVRAFCLATSCFRHAARSMTSLSHCAEVSARIRQWSPMLVFAYGQSTGQTKPPRAGKACRRDGGDLQGPGRRIETVAAQEVQDAVIHFRYVGPFLHGVRRESDVANELQIAPAMVSDARYSRVGSLDRVGQPEREIHLFYALVLAPPCRVHRNEAKSPARSGTRSGVSPTNACCRPCHGASARAPTRRPASRHAGHPSSDRRARKPPRRSIVTASSANTQ